MSTIMQEVYANGPICSYVIEIPAKTHADIFYKLSTENNEKLTLLITKQVSLNSSGDPSGEYIQVENKSIAKNQIDKGEIKLPPQLYSYNVKIELSGSYTHPLNSPKMVNEYDVRHRLTKYVISGAHAANQYAYISINIEIDPIEES